MFLDGLGDLERRRNCAIVFGRLILLTDFDHGLNTAINQLRSALGDSAANPRFIKTLPRRGYRFIAPVEIMPNLSLRIARDSTAVDIGGSDQSEETASRDSRLSILSDA